MYNLHHTINARVVWAVKSGGDAENAMGSQEKARGGSQESKGK